MNVLIIIIMKKFNWKKLIIEVVKLALAFFAGSEVTDGTQILSLGIAGAAAISAGASLLGTAGSAMASGKLNRKTRKWNEKMWNMQNEYNLPQNVMQRFKDAGLNPHLIYGDSGTGTAAQPMSWKPETPDLSGIGDAGRGAVDVYFSTAQKQGVLEQQRLQNALLKTELEHAKMDLGNREYGRFDRPALEMEEYYAKKDKVVYEAEQKRLNSWITAQTADGTISKLSGEVLHLANKNKLIKQELSNKKTAKELMELDKTLKRIDIDLSRRGISRNSPLWERLMMQAATDLLGEDIIDVGQ